MPITYVNIEPLFPDVEHRLLFFNMSNVRRKKGAWKVSEQHKVLCFWSKNNPKQVSVRLWENRSTDRKKKTNVQHIFSSLRKTAIYWQSDSWMAMNYRFEVKLRAPWAKGSIENASVTDEWYGHFITHFECQRESNSCATQAKHTYPTRSPKRDDIRMDAYDCTYSHIHKHSLTHAYIHSETPPVENQDLFARLTVCTYVWIVPDWTLQQRMAKSTERQGQQIAYQGKLWVSPWNWNLFRVLFTRR